MSHDISKIVFAIVLSLYYNFTFTYYNLYILILMKLELQILSIDD